MDLSMDFLGNSFLSTTPPTFSSFFTCFSMDLGYSFLSFSFLSFFTYFSMDLSMDFLGNSFLSFFICFSTNLGNCCSSVAYLALKCTYKSHGDMDSSSLGRPSHITMLLTSLKFGVYSSRPCQKLNVCSSSN